MHIRRMIANAALPRGRFSPVHSSPHGGKRSLLKMPELHAGPILSPMHVANSQPVRRLVVPMLLAVRLHAESFECCSM